MKKYKIFYLLSLVIMAVISAACYPTADKTITYNTAAGYYFGDLFSSGSANFSMNLSDASNKNKGIRIEGFSSLPPSPADFTLNAGTYTLASTYATNTFREGSLVDTTFVGTYVYDIDAKKITVVTGGTFSVTYSGSTYTITTDFTGKDYDSGNAINHIQYSYTGAITFTNKSGLLFTDVLSSNYTATGTPGFLQTPGPTSWAGQITRSTGTDQFYIITGWGGRTTLSVYCDFKSGKIVMDSYSKVAEDQTNGYEGYFQAIAINSSTYALYPVPGDYVVKYDKSKKTLDFSGTYQGFPVYVGVIAKNTTTGATDHGFTDLYANAKLVLTSTLSSSSAAPAKILSFSYSKSISSEALKNYRIGNIQEIQESQQSSSQAPNNR